MIVIGLGSNLNRPLQQLRQACKHLAAHDDIVMTNYSSIYSSAPLLPKGAPASWANKPYLNAAVAIKTSLSPEELLRYLKKIETLMGRTTLERWAPRVIDLDILVFNDHVCQGPELTIPHQELRQRAFALIPLLDVFPQFLDQEPILSQDGLTKLPHLLAGPQIMGIVNVTPDSFSDGGQFNNVKSAVDQAKLMFATGADIIDIGAESTRPGAHLLHPDEEWQRLEPVLRALNDLWQNDEHRPLISVDSRHSATIQRAVALNIDWINDVSQAEFTSMLPIIKEHGLTYIAMHHLSVPPDPKKILEGDPLAALFDFQEHWLRLFEQEGLLPTQLILDPGLGFGKSFMQQSSIINNMHVLTQKHQWLVGHSRKSFLKGMVAPADDLHKEIATAMISAHLAAEGVQYLRVHLPSSTLNTINLRRQLCSQS